MEKQFILCSLTLLEKGTWLVIPWGTTTQVRLSKIASISTASGKQRLTSGWCQKWEKQGSGLQEACAHLAGSPQSTRLRVSVHFFWRQDLSQRIDGWWKDFFMSMSLSTLQFLGPGREL